MSTMPATSSERSLIQSMSADVLYEALVQASGAFVWVVSPEGDVRFANESNARWMGMLIAETESGESQRSAAQVFLSEQPGVRQAIQNGERTTFRGVWRGVLIEVRLVPQSGMLNAGEDVLIVGRPCVLAGSRGGYAAHPLDGESVLDKLTANEREVLELMGLGLKTKEIAGIVHRSEKTIEARRSSIGKKLAMETRGELVRVAARTGLSEL